MDLGQGRRRLAKREKHTVQFLEGEVLVRLLAPGPCDGIFKTCDEEAREK